jgi:hypothetical protein
MSLRDLIESRSAQRHIALRTLWSWVLDAIAAGELIPIFPQGTSLDTPFDHGGMLLTWRKVIENATRSIQRHLPSNDSWANQLRFDPGSFDSWLDKDSPAGTVPALSRLPKRHRPSDPDVRRMVQRYCETEKAGNSSTSIPRMWEYLKGNLPGATREQGIRALRAIEDGPKDRGRVIDERCGSSHSEITE